MDNSVEATQDDIEAMHRHGRLQIDIFTDPIFAENGMIVCIDGQRECWIIDPGLPPQPEEIADALSRLDLKPECILLTHCHGDHIAGILPLREMLGAIPVTCPADEVDLLANPDANLSGAFGMPIVVPPPDRVVRPGDSLTLGDLEFEIRDVAGHSPGGLAYYCAEVGVAIVGDALFAFSIGRYDFPNSSRSRLLRNIRANLLTLPDDTWIYSGHGPPAQISEIKANNITLRMELES